MTDDKRAKCIYELLYNYDKVSFTRIDSNYIIADIWLRKLMTFVYVFYVRLIHDLFLNRKTIEKKAAAKLFAEIYCSPAMYNYLHKHIVKEEPELQYDAKLIVRGKAYYVYARYDEFAFDKALLDRADEDPDKEILSFAERVIGSYRDDDKPIITNNEIVDVDNLEYWVENTTFKINGVRCMLRLLLEKRIYTFVMKNTEARLGPYKDINISDKKAYATKTVDILTIYEYFDEIMEREYSKDGLLWFLAKSGILILVRPMLTANEKENFKAQLRNGNFFDDDDDEDDNF